jgi:predicted nucleic acid-binding protein
MTGSAMIGLDSGFFFRLLAGHPRATTAWSPVATGDAPAAVSCLTLYELDRVALRGALDRAAVDLLLSELPALCYVVWIGDAHGPELLRRAARLAHGTGLAMADALILASLLDAGAGTVYTTDSDFERYDGPATVVVL